MSKFIDRELTIKYTEIELRLFGKKEAKPKTSRRTAKKELRAIKQKHSSLLPQSPGPTHGHKSALYLCLNVRQSVVRL